ncbi:MAG: hypothetical protein IJU40_04765, partial [Desulfovibrionaceae bacterium]|nr:hypothetical protein [Desulfovibrionaceae bacterium]
MDSQEVFNTKSSYFLWHLNDLKLRYSDFSHALNLLEKHGVVKTPAEAGKTLGRLVDNYIHYKSCSLGEVDLSALTAKYLAYKAKMELQEKYQLEVNFKISG